MIFTKIIFSKKIDFSIRVLLVVLAFAQAAQAQRRFVYGLMGGSPVQNNESHFVQQYQLNSPGQELCAATLISKKILITAAHCVYGRNPEISFELKTSSGSVDAQAKVIAIHPGYNPTTYENDIALLALSQVAPSNAYIAKLPKSASDLPSIPGKVIAYGAGRTDGFVNRPFNFKKSKLKKVVVGVYNFNGSRYALDQTKNIGTSVGDSGGPIFYQNPNGELIQIAVISISYGKKVEGVDEHHPDFNASNYYSSHQAIHPHLSWIQKYL